MVKRCLSEMSGGDPSDEMLRMRSVQEIMLFIQDFR